ncbi:MAG: hypothetical protein ACLRFI_01055, partial [Alphaproteobacteria bacterium]
MKKFGIFAVSCTLCNVCFGAASIRASSVPLAGTTPINVPKTTVSATPSVSDSVPSNSVSSNNSDVNSARVSFSSPIGQMKKYSVPSANNSRSKPNDTEREIAALQQQIDDLFEKQNQMENDLSDTVQNEIKNSDLTKNNTFNEAISELQYNTEAIEQVDSKISDKLVENGIVDKQGNLLVATTEEVKPEILSQKLENTFTKKAEVFDNGTIKTDLLPTNVITETNAQEKLSAFAKKSDVFDENNKIKGLPDDIITETNAQDKLSAFAKKADVFDENNKIKGLPDDVITETNAQEKLSVFAKKSDIFDENDKIKGLPDDIITETNAQEKLPAFITDSNFDAKITAKNLATKADLPQIDEKTVNEVLAKSETLGNMIDVAVSDKGYLTDSDLTKEKLSGKLTGLYATKDNFDSLQSTVEKLDGDINTPDSLLHKIKNNSEIQTVLKGEQGEPGESVSAIDVATELKKDNNFLLSVKGEKGADGSGFEFKGNVSSNSERPACTVETQSHAYYNTTDTLLYICSCNGNVCNYSGVPFRGEKGEPGENAETAWHAYCTENPDIVSALYNISDCEYFTGAQYNAIMGGAKAYCLSLFQNKGVLSTTSGIGVKLEKVFGSGTVSTIKNAQTLSSAKINNKNFVDACEERYNEIMSGQDGEDGKNAKSVEQTYCEENLEIVSALYNISDCTKFTNAQYNAIMGGARAYCLSLFQNKGVLSTTSGIGVKLEKVLGGGTVGKIQSATKLSDIRIDNKNFVDACEEKYNEIMSGQDGTDGEDGKSAALIWCEAHTVATGLRTIYNVKKMSAAKTLNAFAARNNSAGLTKASNEGYFTSIDACLEAVEADPSLMGGESAEEVKFNSDVNKNGELFSIDSKGIENLNKKRNSFITDIKGADGKDGENGVTFVPTLAEDGTLSWTKGSASSEIPSSRNIKGADGVTFTPAFNSNTGKLTWTSSKTGVSAPSEMKIVPTNAELENTFAKKSDVFDENNKIKNLPDNVIT